MGALYIKDGKTAFLAERVAKKLGTTKTEAVRQALEAIDAKLPPEPKDRRPMRDRMLEYWKQHPLPPETGLKADKAFFDELSGDL